MAGGKYLLGGLLFIVAAAVGPFLPAWLISLLTISLASALVVLGLILLWRAGLVSFGQALYYAIGAYAVALMMRWTGIHDAFVAVIVAALAAALTAYLVGFFSRAIARFSSPC